MEEGSLLIPKVSIFICLSELTCSQAQLPSHELWPLVKSLKWNESGSRAYNLEGRTWSRFASSCVLDKRLRGISSEVQQTFEEFFFCNAGLVQDMVGQLLEMVKTAFKKSPWRQNQNKNNTHTTNQTQKQPKKPTPTQRPNNSQAIQPGKFKLGETRWNKPPLSAPQMLSSAMQ